MNITEITNNINSENPLLTLKYEPALESLGNEYYDPVLAENFPQHILRWRNNAILPTLGLDPRLVKDEDFINAFGKFQGREPFLALRYHGYQFGQYNPQLGDGRGFLYGQVRGTDGELYDFGTKGSGRTPYSRGGDGMLTLKGGVREVLAAEALHRLGVTTSRCLSMVETGLDLWRGDEPSPTRSSVMIRMSKSHIRFGTFERLHYLKRPDLTQKLLDHVIEVYYPHLHKSQDKLEDKYALFYAELVKRVAELVAQWMSAGFCHAVLNTDNMSITGESFDYGPYAFIPTYDLYFTAAYFDYYKRYCYSQQPGICQLNLELLQQPLKGIIHENDLDVSLSKFGEYYQGEYRRLMWQKLGFTTAQIKDLQFDEIEHLLGLTVNFLYESQVGYHQFFYEMAASFNRNWRDDHGLIMSSSAIFGGIGKSEIFDNWCFAYHQILNNLPIEEMDKIGGNLKYYNPKTALLRPIIESVWERITEEDNWQPFYDLVATLQEGK